LDSKIPFLAKFEEGHKDFFLRTGEEPFEDPFLKGGKLLPYKGGLHPLGKRGFGFSPTWGAPQKFWSPKGGPFIYTGPKYILYGAS